MHDLLRKHWPSLGLAPGTDVFVPLCGKSLDMGWLADAGHRVIGAELSEIAVDEFFAERGLSPTARMLDGFTVKSAGPYELWCGDIFELPHSVVAEVGGTYDRAALIAFPPAEQAGYAERLKALLPRSAPLLLVTLDYDQRLMQGPPFATPEQRVRSLFYDRYAIEDLVSRAAIEQHPHFKAKGLDALTESVYALRPL